MQVRTDIATAATRMTSGHDVQREIRQLQAYLRDGEAVQRMVAGIYGPESGLLVVTDQRVLLLRDGRCGQASEGFPLERVAIVEWLPNRASITISDSYSTAMLRDVAPAEGPEVVELIRALQGRHASGDRRWVVPDGAYPSSAAVPRFAPASGHQAPGQPQVQVAEPPRRWAAPQPAEALGQPDAPQPVDALGQPTANPPAEALGQPDANPLADALGQPTVNPHADALGQPTANPPAEALGQPTENPLADALGQPTANPPAGAAGQPAANPPTEALGQPATNPPAGPAGQPATNPPAGAAGQPTANPPGGAPGQPTAPQLADATGQRTVNQRWEAPGRRAAVALTAPVAGESPAAHRPAAPPRQPVPPPSLPPRQPLPPPSVPPPPVPPPSAATLTHGAVPVTLLAHTTMIPAQQHLERPYPPPPAETLLPGEVPVRVLAAEATAGLGWRPVPAAGVAEMSVAELTAQPSPPDEGEPEPEQVEGSGRRRPISWRPPPRTRSAPSPAETSDSQADPPAEPDEAEVESLDAPAAPRRKAKKWIFASLGAAGLVALAGAGTALLVSAPAKPAATPVRPAPTAAVDTRVGPTVTVTKVIAPDTVEVTGGYSGTVSVLGILVPSADKGQCGASTVKSYASRKLSDATVTLITDPTQPPVDSSGNRLAFLRLKDGSDYSLGAVKAGMARYFDGQPPVQSAAALKAAEADAKRRRAGLWTAPCYGKFGSSSTSTGQTSASAASTTSTTSAGSASTATSASNTRAATGSTAEPN